MSWLKLSDTFTEHPKAVAAGPEGVALFVAGLCYCSRLETDGRIPRNMIPRLMDLKKPYEVAERLITVGLWEDEPGCYIVRNYLEHQRSKSEIEEFREQRREAGRKGGLAKALANTKQTSSTMLGTSQPLASSKRLADTDTDTEADTELSQPTGEVIKCRSCGTRLDPDGYCQTCSVVRL